MTGTDGPRIDLGPAAERVHIRPGDVHAVVGTARRRTVRRRQALAGVTAFSLLVSTAAAVRLTSGDDRGVPVATSGGARQGKVGVTWQRVDPKSTLGMARGLSHGSPIYALSTAPGEREPRRGEELSRVVWRSDDGIEWTPASTLGSDLYLSDLANRDNRVYAVGTSPTSVATASGSSPKLTSADLLVGWSDDGAKQWQKKKLPLELASAPTRHGRISDVEVASGPAGVLAVAVLSAELDVPALLPAGVSAPNGWATTDNGVDLVGPVRSDACPDGYKAEKADKAENGQPEGPNEVMPLWCSNGDKGLSVAPQDARGVTAHYSWADLKVNGDVRLAARRSPVAFFAPAGSTNFERVELPELANVSFLSLEASEHGFDVVTAVGDRYGRKPGGLALLQSTDGRQWKAGSPPNGDQWVSAAGTLSGRTALVTGNDKGGSFTMAGENGGWSTVAWSDLIDPAVLQGRTAHAGTAAIGPFGVVVSVVLAPPEGGTEKELANRLLVSRDGVVWEDFALNELVGHARPAVNRITMVGDKVVVAASVPATGGKAGARTQVGLVGTLD